MVFLLSFPLPPPLWLYLETLVSVKMAAHSNGLTEKTMSQLSQ